MDIFAKLSLKKAHPITFEQKMKTKAVSVTLNNTDFLKFQTKKNDWSLIECE